MVTKTGSIVQAHGMLYKSLDQTVLIYWSDSWVVTRVILKLLEVFHHWAAWRIAGMTDRPTEDGEWE